MDINPNTVEQMAREYNRTLNTPLTSDNSGTLEQIIILEEEQLDLLNDFNTRQSNARVSRTVNYLRNLVYRSLSVLNRMNGSPSYIPSMRNTTLMCPQQSATNRLFNLQLDIFILLDRLTTDYSDRAEISMLENRKAALLASLF